MFINFSGSQPNIRVAGNILWLDPETLQPEDETLWFYEKHKTEIDQLIAEHQQPQTTEEERILAPHRFEIEETYREEGQRAGDRLVASILRQEGFETTSPDEQESARQAIENERAAKGRDDGE